MKRFSTPALLSAALIPAAGAAAAVSHGSLTVEQLNASNNNLHDTDPAVDWTITASTGDFSVFNANRGDVDFEFAPGQDDTQLGVFIGNVTQLSRDNSTFGDATAGDNYVTTFVDYSLNSGSTDWDLQPFYFMPIETTGGSALGDSAEFNINVAVAFFRYDEYLAGYADNRELTRNGANGDPIDIIGGAASTGITLVDDIVGGEAPDPGVNPGAEFFDSATSSGIYTLDMSAITAPSTSVAATPQNGVLLVNGGKNEDNYALSGDNGDGTFTIYSKDNASNGSGTEQDPVAFAYVPLNDPDTVAVGRIAGNGDTLIGSGDFAVTWDGVAEQFLLTSSSADNTNATLIISPERSPLGGLTVDNIVSYEYSTAAGGWLIETRDLPGAGLQTLATDDPAFSFALFGGATPHDTLVIGDTDADGDVDDFDLLAAISGFTGSLDAGTGGKGVVDGDTDEDGDVDDFDLLAMISGFTGSTAAPGSNVPEPGSTALVTLGGLALLRRRRSV